MAKKTIFKGVINGKEYNNVQEYNKELAALIDAGANFSASTSTETVEEIPTESVCEEACMLPYFNDSEYYLDKILSTDPEQNEKNIEKMEKNLTHNYNVVKSQLSIISDNDIKKYIDTISKIMNSIKRDEKYNEDAQEEINKKVEQLEEKYEKQLAAVEAEHDIAMEKYNAEYEILESAEYVMKRLREHYEKILTLIKPKEQECCSCNTCKCGRQCTDESVKTEVKEVKKQSVTDLTSLFNRIFGIDINKL